MAIYAVYIVNKAGTLIYQYDHKSQNISNEKTFSYPLELTLKVFDQKVVVDFGQCDGVKVGHTVLSINGIPAEGQYLEDGREIIQVIEDQSLYPLSIKFGRPSPRPNEKIMLASMFHSFYAIACQLSPVAHSSGIKLLETDTFKLHCTQTLTGLKFVVLTDPAAPSQDALLRKLYEVYSDYALKNPFYILDMPIKCDLFNVNLQAAVEQAERTNAAV